jgi:hypothetical protein
MLLASRSACRCRSPQARYLPIASCSTGGNAARLLVAPAIGRVASISKWIVVPTTTISAFWGTPAAEVSPIYLWCDPTPWRGAQNRSRPFAIEFATQRRGTGRERNG